MEQLISRQQFIIIAILELLVNQRCVIKPLPYISDENCAMIELFKHLKNVEIVKNMNFIQ